jgi:FtsP/CotA-like multicopper oxidase with cupredoxin domain
VSEPAQKAPLKQGVSRRQFARTGAFAAGALLLPFPRSEGYWQNSAGAIQPAANPDYQIEIAEVEWELAPKKKVRTAAYNAQVPGKLIRLREGEPVTIEIVNTLSHAEIVHWHGQWIPPEVDGSMEEGTPMIPPRGRTRVTFTPQPSGLHWYHTHAAADHDLKRGLYSGQFGMLMVEPRQNPARYDQEQFLALHDWEPYLTASDDGSEMVNYVAGSINGRMLGHGEPIQVQQGRRVLFHILNASATEPHWIALPGHRFQVVALDGRPVPTQAAVETLRLGPAERVSAVVTMDSPGVWILGEAQPAFRNAGMGVVVEYAGKGGKPEWIAPSQLHWDYRSFGDTTLGEQKPDVTIPLVFTSKFQGHGAMDKWMINGKSYPETELIHLKNGLRHRLVFDNRSLDDHPVHLHRHAFELVRIRGSATSGVMKDTVIVEAGSRVEADLVAANPGKTLFHCHQQDHMDQGFMMLFDYA